jgi:hypothetical protein
MLHLLLLAKSSENVRVLPSDKGLSLEWGLVLIGVIIGLAVTLMPPKRTSEIKKQQDE